MVFNPLENTLFIGKVLHHLDIVDSTNEYAKILLANSKPIHGTVILSYNQTQGRGQYGRKWENVPDKSVAFTLILKDKKTSIDHQYILNKSIALAVINCIENLLPSSIEVKIKWPNDIFIDGKKVAGILIENSFRGANISSSVIGIGINAAQTEFPEDLPYAGSLKICGDWNGELDEVVGQLAMELERWLMKFYKGYFKEINENYNNKLWKLNQTLKFISPENQEFSGILRGVDERGRIILEQGDTIQVYSHGSIRIKMERQ